MWCVYSRWRSRCCCSVSVSSHLVWIAMSSIYTESHPWATSVRKMVFIIIWKVVGEFVSPKNITVGSNKPSGVRNAAFHSSPSLILMLLYPHRTSTFVKRVHPLSRLMTWGISGDTFWFRLVHLLMGR